MNMTYDAIVVGARAPAHPTAMLLARKGYRRACWSTGPRSPATPSRPTSSMPPGVAALQRWGLLDRVVATGCPPITSYRFDFGPFTISGARDPSTASATRTPRGAPSSTRSSSTRRRDAGVEVREGFNVDEVIVEDGAVVGIRGTATATVTERPRSSSARTAGNSHVAKAVQRREYKTRPRLQYSYYTYFSDLPTTAIEIYIRPDRGFAAAPTNDGLTMVVVGWPYAEARPTRPMSRATSSRPSSWRPSSPTRVRARDARGTVPRRRGPGLLPQALRPGLGARRRRRLQQGPDHRPGHHRRVPRRRTVHDARSTHGSAASRPFDDAMAAWHQAARRRAPLPIYEFTASWPRSSRHRRRCSSSSRAVHGNQTAMDGFVSVMSGALSPTEFFSEDNVSRIFATAPAGVPAG